MSINLNSAARRAREVNELSSSLQDTKKNVDNFRCNIKDCWKSIEEVYLDQGLENVSGRISSIAASLNSISSDIISIANQIKREEEAEERARAEAARRAANQAKHNC